MAAYRADWPVLVLCPASLRDTWAEQVSRWLPPGLRPPGGAVRVLDGRAASFDAALAAAGRDGILICPYSLLGKQADRLLAHGFGVVVADEAHALKNPKAKRSECGQALLLAAKRCLCLTGTPACNRPYELFVQLHCLQRRIFRNSHEYVERYCGNSRFYGQGCTNSDELNAILASTFMIRRLKADVLTQLPPKNRCRVALNCELNGRVQSLMDRVLATPPPEGGWAAASARGGGGEANLMTQLCFETAAMKAPVAAEYLVDTLLDGMPPTDKVLYFAHHSSMLAAAAAALTKARVPFVQIDGATPVGVRSSLVERFQSDPSVRCAVLSIKAAGVGLTLTAASTVCFGELTWAPGEVQQAEDRAHRIGQACCVTVQFLLTPGTADDFVWGSLEKKLNNLGRCLDGQGGAGMHAEQDAGGAALQSAAASALQGTTTGPPRTGPLAAMFAKAAATSAAAAGARPALEPVAPPNAAAEWNGAWDSPPGAAGTEAQPAAAAAGAGAKRPRDPSPVADDDWDGQW